MTERLTGVSRSPAGVVVQRAEGEVEGILAIRKESGPTSHDVVAHTRRILGQRRIGHCGTLDPMASGVLVLCVGRYTRLAGLLSGDDKEYTAVLRLGAVSDTYDAQGRIRSVQGQTGPPTEETVEAAAASFVGEGQQVPPAFSAVKVRGVRSYELARRGKFVDLSPRPVVIYDLRVSKYRFPELHLSVKCSKGTYIRSLAHDLGQKLGCGAYVEALHRTRVGALDESDAITLDELREACCNGLAGQLLIPVERALPQLPCVALDREALEAFAVGREIALNDEPKLPSGGVCLVTDPQGRLWGLGKTEAQGGRLRPSKVMVPGGGRPTARRNTACTT